MHSKKRSAIGRFHYRWHLVLLRNELFAGFRNHPRFVALVEKIRRDLSRQREQLESAKN